MVASTRCWRGVRPVASGGPSGSSLTLRVLFVMADTVRRRHARDQTPVRIGRVALRVAPRTGKALAGRAPEDGLGTVLRHTTRVRRRSQRTAVGGNTVRRSVPELLVVPHRRQR